MIKISNLSKNYSINHKEPGFKASLISLIKRPQIIKQALKNINLNISEGEIIGLIGANGAGKTTLIKILAGIIHPDEGSVEINGFTPWQRDNQLRSTMSLIMGQKAQVWWDLPAMDSFILLKEIYQIPHEIYQKNLDFLSNTLQITGQLKTQVRKLSLGERMKIELMAALLHQPKVIFLDEPTIGLDLSAQKAIRQFLKNYQKEFKPIIILTSHYMQDIFELCPRLAILREGEIVFDGPIQQIKSLVGEKKEIIVTTNKEISSQFLTHLGAEIFNDFSFKVIVQKNEMTLKIQTIINQCQLNDYEIIDLNIQDPSLENIISSILIGKK